jgi:acyl-CoA synthetase (AMP-forming)/AMP-acid ligase II/alkylation response protein AidB-like acyl-CoA dehydrogenase/acyl carrier protein
MVDAPLDGNRQLAFEPLQETPPDNTKNNFNFNNFGDIIISLLRRRDRRTALSIIEDGNTFEYDHIELYKRAIKSAEFIKVISNYGDRIIIAMPTSHEFVEVFMGCLLSGRIAVPLPIEKAKSRFSRVSGVIDDCAPVCAFFRTELDRNKMLEPLAELPTYFYSDIAECEVLEDISIHSSPSRDNIAFIQYTSGSTGAPKGVIITHGNLIANIAMIRDGMRLTPDDKILSWLPLHHDMGLVGMLLTPLAIGAQTVLYAYQEFSKDPLSWIKLLSSHRATVTGAPNFAFDLAFRRVYRLPHGEIDLSNIRLLYCGGEKISPNTIENFYGSLASFGLKTETYFPCYGMAEATLYVSGAFKNPIRPSDSNQMRSNDSSCGIVARGLTVTVTNGQGQVTEGGIGEIAISGPSVTVGYWQNIRKDVVDGAIQVPDNYSISTGDLGFVKNGELYITGRSKDLIIFAGRNIYPDDIEFAIEQACPEILPVNAVVAAAHSDDENQEKIVLIAELARHTSGIDHRSYQQKFQLILNELDLTAERIVFVRPLSLPKTSSGKKQRQRSLSLLLEEKLPLVWDSSQPTSGPKPGARKNSISNENATDAPSVVALDAITLTERFCEWAHTINLTLADERRTLPADFMVQLRDHRLLGLRIPDSLGGWALSHTDVATVGKLLGSTNIAIASFIGLHNTLGVLPILLSTLTNRDNVLKDISTNGRLAAFALTEEAAGSNPRAIQSKVRRFKGSLILDGSKVWIGNAPLADYISVFAYEQDEDGKLIGMSAFLLKRGVHDFRVGEEQLTLGLRSVPQTRLIFRGTVLHDEDRLCPQGQGLSLGFKAMEYARFGLASIAVGAMETAARITQTYAEGRHVATGRLADNELYRAKIGEVSLRIQALDEIVMATGRHMDQTGELIPAILSAVCKILAGEWAFSNIDTCLQLTGGRGYTETFGLARIWRDSRVIRIFEGPTETLAVYIGSLIFQKPDLVENICSTLASAQGALSDPQFNEAALSFSTTLKNVWSGSHASTPSHYTHFRIGMLASEYIAMRTAYTSVSCPLPSKRALRSLLRAVIDQLSEVSVKSLFADIPLMLPSINGVSEQNRTVLYDDWDGSDSRKVDAPENVGVFTPPEAKFIAPQINATADESSTTTLDQLKVWFEKNRSVTISDDNLTLDAFGLDSISALELVFFIEDRFNIVLPQDIMSKPPSLSSLVRTIENTNSRSAPKG